MLVLNLQSFARAAYKIQYQQLGGIN